MQRMASTRRSPSRSMSKVSDLFRRRGSSSRLCRGCSRGRARARSSVRPRSRKATRRSSSISASERCFARRSKRLPTFLLGTARSLRASVATAAPREQRLVGSWPTCRSTASRLRACPSAGPTSHLDWRLRRNDRAARREGETWRIHGRDRGRRVEGYVRPPCAHQGLLGMTALGTCRLVIAEKAMSIDCTP